MTLLGGVDIGGTKCAVSLGDHHGDTVTVVAERRFPTPTTPAETLARLVAALDECIEAEVRRAPQAIGVSCGGPLDSAAGVILSPPNLPGWDHIDVVTPLRAHFGVPVRLQNDANAGALAEHTWGAGRGCRNMVYLTFGTGMGAGLILDGRLYEGTNGLAGEVGHIRLEDDGPIGYGKAGSFEGFCSGGGIAQLARELASARIAAGDPPLYCPTLADLPSVTAQTVGAAAERGDTLAREVWAIVGRRLGQGLAILIDLLNPERIVIGSIYGRQRALLEPISAESMRREALGAALRVCAVLPAALGEEVGNLASLAVALSALSAERSITA